MGKSELMKALLLTVVKARKIVFSFKPNDTHLRLPYPVVDVSRHTPNPFRDADAFSTAYALAFPANMRGIMLSQARAIVKNVAGESKDWNQFRANLKRMERKGTDIQLEALALIEQQVGGLAVGEGPPLQHSGAHKGRRSRLLAPRRGREDLLRGDSPEADMGLLDGQGSASDLRHEADWKH
jgi:hypothetical protein